MIPLLFLLLQAAAAPAPTAPWAPVTKTDAATGASSMSSYALSRDGNARLTVRCDRAAEPVVSVQLRTRQPLAAGADRPVSVTVDGGAPIAGNWEFPGAATFVRDGATVTQLTVALGSAHEIKVRTTDASNAVVEAVFDGPGNPASITQVVEACGYSFGVVPPPVKAAKDKGDQ